MGFPSRNGAVKMPVLPKATQLRGRNCHVSETLGILLVTAVLPASVYTIIPYTLICLYPMFAQYAIYVHSISFAK